MKLDFHIGRADPNYCWFFHLRKSHSIPIASQRTNGPFDRKSSSDSDDHSAEGHYQSWDTWCRLSRMCPHKTTLYFFVICFEASHLPETGPTISIYRDVVWGCFLPNLHHVSHLWPLRTSLRTWENFPFAFPWPWANTSRHNPKSWGIKEDERRGEQEVRQTLWGRSKIFDSLQGGALN